MHFSRRVIGKAFAFAALATAFAGLIRFHGKDANIEPRVLSREVPAKPLINIPKSKFEAGNDSSAGNSAPPGTTFTDVEKDIEAACPIPIKGQKLLLHEDHRVWMFKHRGQEPKGEVIRYGHMATLGLAPNGSLAAAWQASRLYEGASDQRIYVSFSLDGLGARTWIAAQPLPVSLENERGALWSPILVGPPVIPRRLLLLYTESSRAQCLRPPDGKLPELWCPGGTIKAVELQRERSGDGSRWRWSRPWIVLGEVSSDGHEAIPKVIANPPARTASGALVLPYWRESSKLPSACKSTSAQDYAGVLISKDEGLTWRPQAAAGGKIMAPGTHLFEGTVAITTHDSLLMLFRTSKGWAYGSTSHDDGESWSLPKPTSAKNPDTKMHIINLQGQRQDLGLLLAANDHKSFAEAGCRKCRTNLVIKHSEDGGASWTKLAALESPRKPPNYLKNHYPTMLQVGCKLFVAYSRSYSCCAPADAELGVRLVAFQIQAG